MLYKDKSLSGPSMPLLVDLSSVTAMVILHESFNDNKPESYFFPTNNRVKIWYQLYLPYSPYDRLSKSRSLYLHSVLKVAVLVSSHWINGLRDSQKMKHVCNPALVFKIIYMKFMYCEIKVSLFISWLSKPFHFYCICLQPTGWYIDTI